MPGCLLLTVRGGSRARRLFLSLYTQVNEMTPAAMARTAPVIATSRSAVELASPAGGGIVGGDGGGDGRGGGGLGGGGDGACNISVETVGANANSTVTPSALESCARVAVRKNSAPASALASLSITTRVFTMMLPSDTIMATSVAPETLAISDTRNASASNRAMSPAKTSVVVITGL